MQPYICTSPECKSLEPVFHLAKNAEKRCPKCNSAREAHIVKAETIHLLLEQEGGPIKSRDKDYRIACGIERKDVRHLTGEVTAATCLDCLRIAEASKPDSE